MTQQTPTWPNPLPPPTVNFLLWSTTVLNPKDSKRNLFGRLAEIWKGVVAEGLGGKVGSHLPH